MGAESADRSVVSKALSKVATRAWSSADLRADHLAGGMAVHSAAWSAAMLGCHSASTKADCSVERRAGGMADCSVEHWAGTMARYLAVTKDARMAGR